MVTRFFSSPGRPSRSAGSAGRSPDAADAGTRKPFTVAASSAGASASGTAAPVADALAAAGGRDAGGGRAGLGLALGPARRSCTGRHASDAKHWRIFTAVAGCSAGRTAARTQPSAGGSPTRKSWCRRPG